MFASYTPTPEEQAEIERQELEYTGCMRDHGLDWPDPVYDDPAVMDASAACGEIINSPAPEQP